MQQKMSRADAEALAAQVWESLRPHVLRVVTELLCEPEESADDLTPKEREQVERTVRTMRRRNLGAVPRTRGRKAG